MNLRLVLLNRFVPPGVKTAKIRELFNLTAAAFGAALPDLSGLRYGELLEKYACFTKEEGNKVLKDSRRAAQVRRRLHESAAATGLRLRDELKIRSYDEVLTASRIFYRILGIDFTGDTSGNVTIGKCYFSNYYSAENCCLMSALDEGVAEGLSGGELRFSQRISEKRDCCKAKMVFKD